MLELRIIIVAAVAVLLGSRAEAGPEAVQLFREGRELMKAGHLDEACDRFDRSAQLDRKVGTLLNLADCYEQRGKLASAWSTFDAAAVLARQTADSRGAEAARRAALLKPTLPYLTLVIDQSIPKQTIRRNGAAIDPATWNVAIAVDPDTYQLDATAPGFLAWTAVQTVRPGDHVRAVVVLVRDPARTEQTAPPPVKSHLPVRDFGVGIVAGSNSRERPLVGATAVGNLTLPRGSLRGVLSALYSRYEDNVAAEGEPPLLGRIQTFYINVGVDYVWLPVAAIGLGGGIGVGTELDRDGVKGVDFGSALQLRASAVGRLRDGHIEAGLHLQLAFAGSEVTLHGLVGIVWFP